MRNDWDDFFQMFFCSKILWMRFLIMWACFLPLLAIMHTTAPLMFIVGYAVIFALTIQYLRKKHSNEMSRYGFSVDFYRQATTGEQFGIFAFTSLIMGPFGFGLFLYALPKSFEPKLSFYLLIGLAIGGFLAACKHAQKNKL